MPDTVEFCRHRTKKTIKAYHYSFKRDRADRDTAGALDGNLLTGPRKAILFGAFFILKEAEEAAVR